MREYERVWNADCDSIRREFFHGMKKSPKTLEAFSSFTLLFLSPPSSSSSSSSSFSSSVEGERDETIEESRRQLRMAECGVDGLNSKVIRTLQDASLCGGVERVRHPPAPINDLSLSLSHFLTFSLSHFLFFSWICRR